MNKIVYRKLIPNSRDCERDRPVCVIATGLLVNDVDFVDVGNVVAVVVMPVPAVVSTGVDFTKKCKTAGI